MPNFLFFIFIFITGCSYFQKGTLTVFVENNGNPVEKSLISIYSINNLDKLDKLLSQQYSNKNGNQKWNMDYSKLKKIKIVVQNNNIDKLYLPEIVFIETPKLWQDQDLSIHVKIKELNLGLIKKTELQKNLLESKKEPEIFMDYPEDPISQNLSISQIEMPLLPEKNNEPSLNQFSLTNKIHVEKTNIIENLISKNNSTSQLSTITEKKAILFDDSVTLEVYFGGKPQDNVHVFLGRNASQDLSYIGTTDDKGLITFSISNQRRPDIFILKKANFLTVLKPFTSGSGKLNLRIDLQEGKSTDFILQHYAYGIGRGIDKTELKANSLRVDVSGMTGFVTTNKAIDEKVILSLNQKNAIPELIDSKMLKKCLELHSFLNQIPTLYVSSLLPYKPSVGLIEPPIIGDIQTNQLWRRVRREFFSRFMNESYMRGLISEDIVKMSNSIGLSSIEMARNGWKNSSFAADLDLLIQIYFDENEGGKDFTLFGKVYDKFGKLIMDRSILFNSDDAEKVAAKMYASLISSLPIEGGVIKKNKNDITNNLGKNYGVNEGDLFVAFIQKYPFSPPDKPIGILKVKSISDKESLLDIQIGQDKIEKSDVIRVVRYPEKLIQQELQNQIASYL